MISTSLNVVALNLSMRIPGREGKHEDKRQMIVQELREEKACHME